MLTATSVRRYRDMYALVLTIGLTIRHQLQDINSAHNSLVYQRELCIWIFMDFDWLILEADWSMLEADWLITVT